MNDFLKIFFGGLQPCQPPPVDATAVGPTTYVRLRLAAAVLTFLQQHGKA